MDNITQHASHILRASSVKQAKWLYRKAVKEVTDVTPLDSALRQRIGDDEFFKYLVRRDRQEGGE